MIGALGRPRTCERRRLRLVGVLTFACGLITGSACIEEARQSGDFFVRRRRQYQASMSGRCRGAAGTAVATYTRLRTLFAARLAGRFPFVDSVQAAPYALFSTASATGARVVVTGDVVGGVIVRLYVPDVSIADQYLTQLNEVAQRGTFALRPTASYQLQLKVEH